MSLWDSISESVGSFMGWGEESGTDASAIEGIMGGFGTDEDAIRSALSGGAMAGFGTDEGAIRSALGGGAIQGAVRGGSGSSESMVRSRVASAAPFAHFGD